MYRGIGLPCLEFYPVDTRVQGIARKKEKKKLKAKFEKKAALLSLCMLFCSKFLLSCFVLKVVTHEAL